MRGVPNRVFFAGGYMGVCFTCFFGKVVPFSSRTSCQLMPAVVSLDLIEARDRHLSKLQ